MICKATGKVSPRTGCFSSIVYKYIFFSFQWPSLFCAWHWGSSAEWWRAMISGGRWRWRWESRPLPPPILSLVARSGRKVCLCPLAVSKKGVVSEGILPATDRVTTRRRPPFCACAGWSERRSPTGDVYYVNHVDKSTSWSRPVGRPLRSTVAVPVAFAVGERCFC